MLREEVFNKLQLIFKDYFDDQSIEISEYTTSKDIEAWDSFEHINLMLAVEDEFDIEIPMGQIVKMKNVGELVDIILEKCN